MFTLYLTLVASCGGGQSGDPGVKKPDNTPVFVPRTDCTFSRWLHEKPEPEIFRCNVTDPALVDTEKQWDDPVGWTCDCDGTASSVEAMFCEDALLEACNVESVSTNHYCEPPIGSCFPENDDASRWSCRCGEASARPGERVESIETKNCSDAAGIACSERCESDVGACVSDPFDPGTLVCTCAPLFIDPSSPTKPTETTFRASLSLASCDETLAEACGGVCKSETGICTYEGDAFACACSDQSSANVDLATLGPSTWNDGSVLCHEAMFHLCGMLSPGETCHSESPGGTGNCEGRPVLGFPDGVARQDNTFDCSCSATAQDAGGPTSLTLQADDCAAALTTACPEAIRPVADVNGPTLDYGRLCTSDDQCSGGACYVPGRPEDPICSKHCETNADCPDFAECVAGAGGYCFVRCAESDVCRALNQAINNPLYCTNAYDAARPSVCVQESEP